MLTMMPHSRTVIMDKARYNLKKITRKVSIILICILIFDLSMAECNKKSVGTKTRAPPIQRGRNSSDEHPQIVYKDILVDPIVDHRKLDPVFDREILKRYQMILKRFQASQG